MAWVAPLLVHANSSLVVIREICPAHLTAAEVAQAGMLLLPCGQ
jgi:hypothetical protein